MTLLRLPGVVILGATTLAAQTPGTPAFEVASVKPNVSGATGTASYVLAGGRYNAINVTLRMLMKTAYQIHDTQLSMRLDGSTWTVSMYQPGRQRPRLRRRSSSVRG